MENNLLPTLEVIIINLFFVIFLVIFNYFDTKK